MLQELAYFWGLAGAPQALLTPDLSRGFPSWYYLEYFLGHGIIFAGLAYLIGVQGFRPGPGAVLRVMLALNAYAVVVGAIDYAFDWNYGYLCQKAPGSLMESMGPWPWYLLVMEAVALVNFVLLARLGAFLPPGPAGCPDRSPNT
ncbi:MAG: TIGR02206 family membrane protein, partial [Candidatus Eremiobacterota bacterium]